MHFQNHIYLLIFQNDYGWTTRACSSLVVLYKILQSWFQSWFRYFCHVPSNHYFHFEFFQGWCPDVISVGTVGSPVSGFPTPVTSQWEQIFLESRIQVHWYRVARRGSLGCGWQEGTGCGMEDRMGSRLECFISLPVLVYGFSSFIPIFGGGCPYGMVAIVLWIWGSNPFQNLTTIVLRSIYPASDTNSRNSSK